MGEQPAGRGFEEQHARERGDEQEKRVREPAPAVRSTGRGRQRGSRTVEEPTEGRCTDSRHDVCASMPGMPMPPRAA